VIKKPKVIF
jgi:alpha-glucosidase